ncbi:MAG: tRNA preQ1(34) S-adenosylmethionine ribosyltransferase-isomerase QueA [Oscillospiraceae bacterium]|nr:tRNA preQ1(34) S-adenosylmethionine ribosyltransferase-isomerase QueA [Oscillospiraceae bacterium]MDD5920690.1 tRNA preQ1(34) S-adenosylmethionine ribosyltransferase-isomerase QueA [Oscillospiraceae bacterium]
MKKSDFWYDLPESLIAQTPVEPRDHSRLMHLSTPGGQIEHLHFYDLLELLRPGDCLIVNDSRVLPARLYGTRSTGARIEMLLLEQKQTDVWEVLVKPGKKALPGVSVTFGDGLLRADVLEVLEGGNRLVRFSYEGNFYDILEKIGQMPLPHYITAKLQDNERYQTVYSHELGSAAAPTAGLHFTLEMMDKLRQKGVQIGYVTLHVGLGTFRPVKVDEITEHKMHSEHYRLPEETARLIRETKAAGGRVIAVGTTSTRTLESVAAKYGDIRADEGYTDIFLYPGCTFRVLDGLITNFHLPESTLIMLVSAFAGYENTMHAYQIAVQEQYRFYSFGDAMFIEKE